MIRGVGLVGLVSITACIHDKPFAAIRALAGNEVAVETRSQGSVEASVALEQAEVTVTKPGAAIDDVELRS